MSLPPDYYEILKISKKATMDEIRSSYKNLAKQHHPDKGGDKEKFQEIQTAYEILSDDNKKREYDFQRNNVNNNAIPNFFHQQQHHHQQFPFNFFNFTANANEGNGLKKRDEIYNCKINLKEVFFGTFRKFHIVRKTVCDKCNIECHNCNGTGFDKNNQRIQIGPFLHIQNQICVLCNGQGFKKLPFCDNCENSGFKIKNINIEILIPKGVENGKTYSYEGCGEQAMKKNEINGNFIVVIEIIEDNLFKRSSNFDLIFEHQISLKESIIGKNVIIPHMEETFVIDIKQFCIINPNRNYIIPKKGLQDELGNKGNLILKFKIIYPDRFLNSTELKSLENVFKNIEI
jgi:DnaJ family protein A protein 2